MIVTLHAASGAASHVARLAGVGLGVRPLAPTLTTAALADAMDDAAEDGHDLVVALSLESLADPRLRCRTDLAVVVLGPEPVSAALGLAAALVDGANRPVGTSPAWLLDCRAGPAGHLVRALPTALPGAAYSKAGHGDPAAVAARLAASLLLAASDPWAYRLSRELLVEALDATTARGARLRERLVAISADLDESPTAHTSILPPARRARGADHGRGRDHGRTSRPVAPKRLAFGAAR
jgi:hypothetical protein